MPKVNLEECLDGTFEHYGTTENPYLWRFQWLVRSKLALMPWPRYSELKDFLIEKNIRHVVSLSPECPLDDSFADSMTVLKIAVDEFSSPSLSQIREFIDFCEKQQGRDKRESEVTTPIGIHCRQGLGRTGTLAACYLVRFYGSTPATAISNVRKIRPYSIETWDQERCVFHYYDYLCANPPEDECWRP